MQKAPIPRLWRENKSTLLGNGKEAHLISTDIALLLGRLQPHFVNSIFISLKQNTSINKTEAWE